jgi:hypothetical protein
MLRSADVTTPLPSDMTDYGLPKGPSSATVVSFSGRSSPTRGHYAKHAIEDLH